MAAFHINAARYFEGVPQAAWESPIGEYQPAQKWLKDRRGRALSYDDIGHYQKIVTILVETGRIMGEVELPLPRVRVGLAVHFACGSMHSTAGPPNP